MGQDNAQLIAAARWLALAHAPADYEVAAMQRTLQNLADALELATPRVVTEVAELYALPDSAVVMDCAGIVYEKWRITGWFTIASEESDYPLLPATVLFTPTGKETE